MSKRVAYKPFTPKPWTAGERVEWEDRAGVVWSAGPQPASVWVVPDDAPTTLVAVKLPSSTRIPREIDTLEAARTRLQAAERVRHATGLVTASRKHTPAYSRPRAVMASRAQLHMHHVDAACPAITPGYRVQPFVGAGLYGELNQGAFADALLRGDFHKTYDACEHCIWGRALTEATAER